MITGNPEKTNKDIDIKKRFVFPTVTADRTLICRGHVTEPLIRLFTQCPVEALEEVTEAENSKKKSRFIRLGSQECPLKFRWALHQMLVFLLFPSSASSVLQIVHD